jgi:hypothetical protein
MAGKILGAFAAAAAAAWLTASLGGCAHGPSGGARCDQAAATADAAGPGCAEAWMDRHLRVNDVMTVGTHNSYKMAIPPALFALVKANAPQVAETLDYSHAPLAEQLDDGARQLELDVVYDPKGGRYASPLGAKVTGEKLTADYLATMAKPGFKVMHAQDFDFHVVCVTFVQCLTIVRDWSRAHPRHTPILIILNAKDGPSGAPGGVTALAFDAAAFDALDAEIGSVLSARDLITPDAVQGKYPTLRDAVRAGAWPLLGAARGKILMALDEDPRKVALYRGARKSLEGRRMFVNTDEDSPAAAYLTLNEPIEEAKRITAAVKAGYIVRTRADADTFEARKGDTARREAAFASGAQYVSTDYRTPDLRFGPYQVRLPGKTIAVCNTVRAAGRCGQAPIETGGP